MNDQVYIMYKFYRNIIADRTLSEDYGVPALIIEEISNHIEGWDEQESQYRERYEREEETRCGCSRKIE